ncbi:MAG TPA: outer membrane beta-barrel protein [Candidatus Polarisedimenticolaceae bacterium]
MSRFGLRWVACAAAFVAFANVQAEDVAKKFRLGFSLGGYDTETKVKSDSANSLFITDASGLFIDAIRDPRNDDAAIGELGIKPQTRASLSASYAFNSMFVLEASIGYQKGDVGDVEMQAQLVSPQQIPSTQEFLFDIFRFPAGEMSQIPIEITALARFRPKAALSPYLGAGVGYRLVSFTASTRLNEVSAALQSSRGGLATLTGFFGARGFSGVPEGMIRSFGGAEYSAPDSFQWQAVGGFDYAFNRHWTGFVDLRYVFASREFSLTFDGRRDFGNSVPNQTAEEGDELATASYGAIEIVEGGLVDAGRLVPGPGAPAGTDCAQDPTICIFDYQPDGVRDTGYYYLKGGAIRYGGVALQFGVRYTF